MIAETSAVRFRQNLGDMLNQVHYRSDSIVINKDGKSIADLVGARLFERIRRMQARFDSLSQRLAQGFAVTPQDYLITGDKALLALAHKYPMFAAAEFWQMHGAA